MMGRYVFDSDDFAGIPILYSWPSQGATMGYLKDADAVRFSKYSLRDFFLNR